MIIRRMRSDDLSEVVRIENDNFSMPWSMKSFEDSLSRDYNIYLVAEEDGKIAGYCGMLLSPFEGQINNVCVDKAFRCRGIGSKMLKSLLETGKERGITEFTLEVRKSNEKAIALYEKLGFVSEGIRKGFYDRPKEDAVIMWIRQ